MNIRTLATTWHGLAAGRIASLAAIITAATIATGCYREIKRCDEKHPCKPRDASADVLADGSADGGAVDAPAGFDTNWPYVPDAITVDGSEAGAPSIVDASVLDAPDPSVTTNTKPVTATSLTTETKPATTTAVTTTTGSPLATNTQTANATGPVSRTTTAVETYPIPSTNTVATIHTVLTTAIGTASASAIATATAPDQVGTATGTVTSVVASSGMVTVTATSAVQGTQTVSTTAVLSSTATGIGTYSGSDDWSSMEGYYKLEGSGPSYQDSAHPSRFATAQSTGTDIGAIPGSTTSVTGQLLADFSLRYGQLGMSLAFWAKLLANKLPSGSANLHFDGGCSPQVYVEASATSGLFDVVCHYQAAAARWTTSLPAGQWNHFVCTVSTGSPDQEIRLYLNGNEVSTTPYTIIAYSSGCQPKLNWGGARDTGVAIDEVRAYNRKLTSAEVSALHSCNMSSCPTTQTTFATGTGLSNATITNLTLATKTEYALTSGATTAMITATQTSLATGLTATAAASVTATALGTGTATESTIGFVPTTATASRTTTVTQTVLR